MKTAVSTMAFNAQVPGELRFRDVVGAMLRAACRYVEDSENRGDVEWRVLSAFNEAFNNVALHSGSPDVGVALRVGAKEIVLEVTDDGRGFELGDRAGTTLGPVEDLDRGGMGLFIIRQAMTTVSYERGSTNRLTMTLDLDADADGASGAAAG